MADNIVHRMMDNEADANKDIAAKSFHHTTQPTTPSKVVTFIDQSTLGSGLSVHEELLRRAAQKASLASAAKDKPSISRYRDSLVGAAGQDKELRRAITLKNHEDRIARKRRFAPLSTDTPTGSDRFRHRHDRQKFNITGSAPDAATGAHDRQTRNPGLGDAPQQKIAFQEPSSRQYNPFK
ncbi:hypothetical protein I8H83_02305 [Candidatus Saccharibacteria bacterium]|nr:hypothetical protein [Candidatus Saccharibacteria bacterium]